MLNLIMKEVDLKKIMNNWDEDRMLWICPKCNNRFYGGIWWPLCGEECFK